MFKAVGAAAARCEAAPRLAGRWPVDAGLETAGDKGAGCAGLEICVAVVGEEASGAATAAVGEETCRAARAVAGEGAS